MMKSSQVTVSTSTDEALCEAAKLFVQMTVDAASKRERVSVALSGGNTPRGLFHLLSDRSEAYFPQIPWSQIDFFWGDERFVPPTDKNSNYLMAKNALLDRVPVGAAQVHRMMTENGSPEECAQNYQNEILKYFRKKDLVRPPMFDLVLLGMGPDGHTASLFPDAPLQELETGPFSHCWVKSFFVPHLKDEQPLRISFTPKLINAAHNVIFLVTGADKALAYEQVFHSDKSPYEIPSKLIHPHSGKLIWVVDQEVVSHERLAS